MNVFKKSWWHDSIEHVLTELESNAQVGLTTAAAHQRLTTYGKNILPSPQKPSSWIIFLQQFSSLYVLILLAAFFISLFVAPWLDAAVIALILIVNTSIGFFQEYRAQQLLWSLKSYAISQSTVIRDGHAMKIPTSYLVPGDIVLLHEGDHVPADGRILKSASLTTQEAALTGESTSILKSIDPIKKNTIVADRINMAFMGTTVVAGHGIMVVVATGINTEFGSIMELVQHQAAPKTPLQQQVHHLSITLLWICLCIMSVTSFIMWLSGLSLFEMLPVILSLSVAAIPEGLPAILTVALAIGMQRMVQRNALVQKLSSVETLGNASVICTDKTGTLTQNRMVVRAIFINNKIIAVSGEGYEPTGSFFYDKHPIDPPTMPDLMLALEIGTLCSTAYLYKKNNHWFVTGDPTEGALVTVAAKANLDKHVLENTYPRLQEHPFDPAKRWMITVHEYEGKTRIFIKGAYDSILNHCSSLLLNNTVHTISNEDKKNITTIHSNFAQQGLRIIAVAYKDSDEGWPTHGSMDNLIFVGLFALVDPPRSEAKAAIQTCKKAGIIPIMITGDHTETAFAIAHELGIIDTKTALLEGKELETMNDTDFYNLVPKIRVYARTSAQQKIRIVKAWQKQGAVVAMTGDGVNDAPAIKIADIGVAMGQTGTEITKESADIILLDDNFATLVYAIKEGRIIYNNIVKSINYLISSNIAELIIIVTALFGMVAGFFPTIPLYPIQLLWINLLTDGLPAIALSFDTAPSTIMQQPPRTKNSPLIPPFFALEMLVMSLFLAAGTLVAFYFGLQHNMLMATTMAFTTLILLELVRVHTIRARTRTPFFSNMWLYLALLLSLLAQCAIVYIPWLQPIFKTVPLSSREWLIMCIILLSTWLISFLTQKIFSYLQRTHT